MTSISSLPLELLSNIFNKFDNLAQLTEFRLVCKAWKDPVEREMLGRTITISPKPTKMESFSDFLQIDPTRVSLMKHVHFDPDPLPYRTIYMDVLELVAGSNVESITGVIEDSNLFYEFTETVESSPYNLSRLKHLTLSHAKTEPPVNVALHCRRTIQTMALHFNDHFMGEVIDWNFMDRLDEFQHLTSFTLTAAIDTIGSLNRILDKCPHLQHLSLETTHWQNSNDDRLDLDHKAGKRHLILKSLEIHGPEFSSHMVEYFLYKLINLDKISIDVTTWDRYISEEDTVRIANLIQRVPQKELIYTVETRFGITTISSCLERAGYNVKIENPDAPYSFRVKVVI